MESVFEKCDDERTFLVAWEARDFLDINIPLNGDLPLLLQPHQ